uniref:ATPase subunit 6 n=1 Tax=Angomonas deanei TaxID=59799 RepID=A0A077EXZ0_9TRYP|nr:ATPase subunit 6 [Angomonas deanei]
MNRTLFNLESNVGILLRGLIALFYVVWSRVSFIIYFNCLMVITDFCVYSLMDIYLFVGVCIFLCCWFVSFNFYSLIVYYCISYLNVYILFCIAFMYYMAFLFSFCFLLDFIIFSSLLVGDSFMDVFFLRYLLCLLECFSLLCRCISTFLRMFCNLFSSHFLMLMFCDFVYFFIVFFYFLLYVILYIFWCFLLPFFSVLFFTYFYMH